MFGSELASVLRSFETLSRMISTRASSDALNMTLSGGLPNLQHNADYQNVKTSELPSVVTQFMCMTYESSRSDSEAACSRLIDNTLHVRCLPQQFSTALCCLKKLDFHANVLGLPLLTDQ